LVDSCDNPACCPVAFKDRFSNVDWKSSNYLYIEYILQGAAYTSAYNEEKFHEWANRETVGIAPEFITDRWVIRLGKEDADFDPWHCEEGTFEQDFSAFLNALALKNSIEAIETRMDAYTDARRAAVRQIKKAVKEADKNAAKEKKAEEKAAAKLAKKESLKIKCKSADKYLGIRKPTCCCETCLKKYQEVQTAKKVSLQAATSSLLGVLK